MSGISGDDCGSCSMSGVVVSQNEVFTQAPPSTSLPDSNYNPQLGGKAGEAIVAELHGKYYTQAYRGKVYMANRTAVTVPVVASTMVSVFSLYNPVSSPNVVELVDMDIGLVLATTVVDTVGIYWQNGATAAAATFTTAGVLGTNFFNANVGTAASNQATFYSALTHSGTPVRIKIISQFGAVTSTNDSPIHYDFDGKVILPPGSLISVAMSTAASTASGVDLALTWAEYPV